jgi:hypothetical protein
MLKVALAGIPLTPIERITGAIFYSATEPDRATNGSVWLVQGDEPVFRLEQKRLTTGLYHLINERSKWADKYD